MRFVTQKGGLPFFAHLRSLFIVFVYIIIDKSTIWYGSVNILGFHSIEDNLIRFKNIEIASSLLESLQKWYGWGDNIMIQEILILYPSMIVKDSQRYSIFC